MPTSFCAAHMSVCAIGYVFVHGGCIVVVRACEDPGIEGGSLVVADAGQDSIIFTLPRCTHGLWRALTK